MLFLIRMAMPMARQAILKQMKRFLGQALMATFGKLGGPMRKLGT